MDERCNRYTSTAVGTRTEDHISVNSITFGHSNLYTHALEVVKLGDANQIAYDCAMELLRSAMYKLMPLASEHDGLGLEHKIEFNKPKGTELSVFVNHKKYAGVMLEVVQLEISLV